MAKRNLHRPPLRRTQRGVSLIFTLIALVLLMLTSIALVRSVDTATLVMGNLGFKQDTTNRGSSSTSGAELAIKWITDNSANLNNTQANLGYYATSLDDLDPTGSARDSALAAVNWESNDCADLVKGTTYNGTCMNPSQPVDVLDKSGNKIGSANYLIARLCSADGDPNGRDASGNVIVCSKPTSASTSDGQGRGSVDSKSYMRLGTTTVGPYFRIVVRVQDLRNTVSFTETIVHF